MQHDIDMAELEKLFHEPIPELVEFGRVQAKLAKQFERELVESGFLPADETFEKI